jgi:hypothetical protein
MEAWDRYAWVTRTKPINQYSVDGDFSGWSIGMGSHSMIGRLYDKSLEIEISGKHYLMPLWIEAGWDVSAEANVWRLDLNSSGRFLLSSKCSP